MSSQDRYMCSAAGQILGFGEPEVRASREQDRVSNGKKRTVSPAFRGGATYRIVFDSMIDNNWP